MTAPNHLATREKRKTMTRRLDNLKEINKEPDRWECVEKGIFTFIFHHKEERQVLRVKPRYNVGETVYIKEVWRVLDLDTRTLREPIHHVKIEYKLDCENKWVKIPATIAYTIPDNRHSPLFLPATAARDFIKINNVGIDRLQNISSYDIQREGCPIDINRKDRAKEIYDTELAIEWFRVLWNSINGKTYPWELNPWSWVYSYNLLEVK